VSYILEEALMDADVYAIIAIENRNGKIKTTLVKNELIVDAMKRLIHKEPNCKVRLFMRELHPKYFVHPNIQKKY